MEGDYFRRALILDFAISIHSLRVEGDVYTLFYLENMDRISIHSLRVEGDGERFNAMLRADDFNPLPPCGGRQKDWSEKKSLTLFQSTPSVWRETDSAVYKSKLKAFQSTPSVWRETDSTSNLAPRMLFQSTPSVWRETRMAPAIGHHALFQSTPSVWRETKISVVAWMPMPISIHSLRVEGDLPLLCSGAGGISHFNPLPPCGGRPRYCLPTAWQHPFQSTPSVWRETIIEPELFDRVQFQSTPSVWRETVGRIAGFNVYE